MAPRIQLLPPALADQIAAGEVVERPASVVKELVENALDAGAARVEVEIERGGLGRIRVTDDGEGMSPEDAHLALRRHATSKLRTADELFRLGSYGFRGEALPSIASVCTLELTTRRADQPSGYQLRVASGRVDQAREVGAPVGTRVEARELFASVPARLKFQKAPAVEAGHVVDGVVRLALADPRVHLRARVDGRVVVELPPHASLAERATAVVRRTAPGAAIASARVQEGGVTVEVHVAGPEHAVQTARRVHLVVNRRAVRDRGLLAAVQVGFGELLPRGRHPLAVVAIALPSGEVDVNVHPQKLEVRLLRGAEVYAAVRHAVARAVAAGGFSAQRHAGSSYAAEAPEDPLGAGEPEAPYEEPLERGAERGRAYELVRALAGEDAARIEAEAPAVSPPSGEPSYVGALPGGYLLFRDPTGLLVVDQHAASALVRASERPDADELEIVAAAVPPTAALDEAAATALLASLRALQRRGRWVTLEEARWRGRRALARVPLSELWRRLEQ